MTPEQKSGSKKVIERRCTECCAEINATRTG
jgi:hypothetical protein